MKERLWQLLKQRRMTQAEFARRLGVSVSGLCLTQKFSPSVKKLKEYADVLGVPVWELLVDCGEPIQPEDQQLSSATICHKCGATIDTNVNITIIKK